MADRFYSLNYGETEVDVTEGAATSSEDVEIRIDLAPGMKRSEVLILIDEIKKHILKDTWPPA